MCGLGVILRTGPGPIPGGWLDALDEAVAARGPDGAGRFRDVVPAGAPGAPHGIAVAMVHRRLAVIDPAGGEQPMTWRDPADPREGLVAVVFNGFVANHRDLRAELAAAGRDFASDHSDTEVLVHGTAAWGDRLAGRLEGMVAAATWDRRARRLRLLRDRFGEKPLWVARRRRGETERLLVAGSHAAAVARVAAAFDDERPGARPDWSPWPEHAWPADAPEAADELAGVRDRDPAAADAPHAWLDRYLALGYAHPIAPGGVRAVPPPPLPAAAPPTAELPEGDDALLAAVDAALGRAVERRLESDVPLGCFLSGGIDSTLVTAHVRRRLGRVPSFTVRMPDARHDESAHAAAAARALDTEHHVLEADPDLAGELDRLVAAAGLPLADSSILPAAWVCRAARELVTCCLGGDGGDELFAGYDRYRGASLLARARPLLARLPAGLGAAAGRHPRGRWRRLGRLGAMARDWPRDGILAMERIMPGPVHRDLHRRGGTPSGTPGGIPAGAPAGAAEGTIAPPPWPVRHPRPGAAAGTLRALDLRHYLPGDLMAKMDTASMARALEVRSPMLDRDLTALALAIPVRRHLAGGTKSVLRRLARPILGPSADRPKQGFAIPLDDWLRDPRSPLRTRLDDALASAEPFGGLPVDVAAARRLRDEHAAGRRDRGAALFALLALATWAAAEPTLAR